MRVRLLLGMLVAAGLSASPGPQEGLEGCSGQEPLVRALGRIQALNWGKVNIEQIQAIWPAHLYPIDCDGDECDSVGSKGRIIDGYCECCDTFVFGKREREGQSRRLESVVLKFSARKRAEIVASARSFASAVGIPQHDSQKIRDEGTYRFQWEGPQHYISAAEIQFTERKGLWTLHLAWSRYLAEP